MNGVPVTDMDSFLAVISVIGDRTDVRLRCVDLQDRKRVFTLRTDLHYWPTVELRREVRVDDAAERRYDIASEWRLIRHRPTLA